ncbi:MAG: outer membrane lipid asymmetry maintenance protein MlaD, partial [Burkholderiaceae bacterium]|nr:outer membrane lipid asymmetry maintenance protein MlaD [Burkholderiaceae bacterium]
GDQYIGIDAGADEKNWADGDTVTRTQSAVVLENLISQFLYNSAASGNNSSGGASGGTAAKAPGAASK